MAGALNQKNPSMWNILHAFLMYLKQEEYLSLEMIFEFVSSGLVFMDAVSVLTHLSYIILLNCNLLPFHTNLYSISILLIIIYFGSNKTFCQLQS